MEKRNFPFNVHVFVPEHHDNFICPVIRLESYCAKCCLNISKVSNHLGYTIVPKQYVRLPIDLALIYNEPCPGINPNVYYINSACYGFIQAPLCYLNLSYLKTIIESAW